MFKIGKKYRHRNCLDIDILVATIGYRTIEKDGFQDLEVFYVNRRYGFFCHPRPEWVRIQKEQLSNWKEV